MQKIRSEIIVRQGRPSDLTAVMALEEACFAPGVSESTEVYESRVEAFPDGFLVAYHVNSHLGVGYSTSERWLKRPVNEYDFTLNTKTWQNHAPTGSVYYISSLAIRAEFRGQGIGETLLTRSTDIAQRLGCREAILIVGSEWKTAIRLYERLGFKPADIRKGFFQPLGHPAYDGIVMIKSLIPHF